jgi:starch phosphorylase
MPIDPILLDAFNAGDHIGALAESNKADAPDARALSRRHAGGPGAAAAAGVFFSSASLQDILRRHLQQYGDLISCPTRRRSSSTTRTRPSQSPS